MYGGNKVDVAALEIDTFVTQKSVAPPVSLYELLRVLDGTVFGESHIFCEKPDFLVGTISLLIPFIGIGVAS